MVYIYTEPLAILSACGFMYYALKVNPKSSTRTKDIVMSAFFLGLLALTRVEFGYVITCALFIYAIWYVIKRSKKAFHSLMILAGALAFCLPYLYYTYNLTGKAFLWGTQGGAVLYWRATPFENEYGDWISSGVVLGIQKDYPYDTDISALAENHLPFIEKVESSAYSAAQKDQMYRQKAFEYMKMYPVKYLKNTGISALRLFFEYPISYKTQKLTTYFYLLPNIFLVMLLLIAIYLTFLKAPAIPFEVIFIALIMLISVGGMILASGRVRHLLPIVPMFSFYIAYTIVRFTKIEIK
ncbi:hypothetical protein [Pareuzebyella sediminis]|uniref:hypothetical protein n=1 Tax=Pareuzebyella sediminis TaxID=2607998 RepID=UPI0011EE4FD7|nr:hypothetical protein [Pareuzebyella sediminis]